MAALQGDSFRTRELPWHSLVQPSGTMSSRLTVFFLADTVQSPEEPSQQLPGTTHPVCQVRMWWGLLGGVAPISLDGVELLWL